MTCPKCGSDMRVADTHESGTDSAPTTERVRVCACGDRYVTEERIKRRLAPIRSPNSAHSAISGNKDPVNGAEIAKRTAENEPKTDRKPAENGSAPTLFPDPIRSESGHFSDLPSDRSQEVDRVKAEYEPEFLAFWEGIEPIARRKGDKAEAQKVWRKKGRPNSAKLIAGWNRYRISCGDGYTMDADRWLRGDGWLKEYEAAPPARVNGTNGAPPPQYRKLPEIPRGVAPPPRPRP